MRRAGILLIFAVVYGAPLTTAVAAKANAPVATQGSGGNVLAALCSFFVPGLGQLFQGRIGAGLALMFGFPVASVIMFVWAVAIVPELGILVVILAILVHFAQVYDAAVWKPGDGQWGTW